MVSLTFFLGLLALFTSVCAASVKQPVVVSV